MASRALAPSPEWPVGSRMTRGSSPTQSLLESQPGVPSSASSGAAPPRERVSGGQRRRFPATSALSRPIKNGRARLDRIPIRSEPLDLDPTAHTRRYRFGLAILLKRPWIYFKSTRSPVPFKTISNHAQIYSLRPLSFIKMEPAIHP